MKSLILFAAGLVLALGLYSCQCEGCNRLDRRCEVNFIRFDSTELTTVILKRYVAATNFTQLQDSIIYPGLEVMINLGTNDTARTFAFSIIDGSDYGIKLATGEELEISDIKLTMENCKTCAKIYHIQTLESYRIFGHQVVDSKIELRR